MLNFQKNAQASLTAQGNLGTVNAVDSRVARRCNMGSFDFTTRNHSHLHQTETDLLWERKTADESFLAYAELG